MCEIWDSLLQKTYPWLIELKLSEITNILISQQPILFLKIRGQMSPREYFIHDQYEITILFHWLLLLTSSISLPCHFYCRGMAKMKVWSRIWRFIVTLNTLDWFPIGTFQRDAMLTKPGRQTCSHQICHSAEDRSYWKLHCCNRGKFPGYWMDLWFESGSFFKGWEPTSSWSQETMSQKLCILFTILWSTWYSISLMGIISCKYMQGNMAFHKLHHVWSDNELLRYYFMPAFHVTPLLSVGLENVKEPSV